MANTSTTCSWHDTNGINRSYLVKEGVHVFSIHQPIHEHDGSRVMLLCGTCKHNGKMTILRDAFTFVHKVYGHPLQVKVLQGPCSAIADPTKAFSVKLYGSNDPHERIVLEIAQQDGDKVDVFFRRDDGCVGKSFPMTVVKSVRNLFKHFPRDRAPQRPRLVVKFPSVPIPRAPGGTVHARRSTIPRVEIPVLRREQAFTPEILDRIEVRLGLIRSPQPSSEEHSRAESGQELRRAARTPGLFVTPRPTESKPSTAAPRCDKASRAEAMTQRGRGSSFTPFLRQLEVANQSANVISRSISGLSVAAGESKVRANTTDAVNGATEVKREATRPTDMKIDTEVSQ